MINKWPFFFFFFWSRRLLDKHKRIIDTIHGQDIILLNDELDSIRPDMLHTLESLHWPTSLTCPSPSHPVWILL